MRLPRSGNFYFALVILIFLLLLVGTTFSYDEKAGLVPLTIGIPTVLLVLLELARDRSRTLSRFLKTKYADDTEQTGENKGQEIAKHKRKEIVAILSIIAYVALVMVVGFHLAIPIFVIFYCLIFARASWRKILLLTTATWGFIYLVFCIAMEFKFPWGFVF